MNPDLKKRAKKAGITLHEKPCAACAGTGTVVSVDGLDLARVRSKAEVSRYRVAQMGEVQPSYITMIEEADPEKAQRRCPEKLLEIYLKLSEEGVPDELKMSTKGKRLAGYAAGAKKLRETNLLRPPAPKVKKGQIWQEAGLVASNEIRRRVEVLYVEDSTALVRRFDEPEAAGVAMRTETLIQKWTDVTAEVRG